MDRTSAPTRWADPHAETNYPSCRGSPPARWQHFSAWVGQTSFCPQQFDWLDQYQYSFFHPRQKRCQFFIPARRWTPFHLHGLRALRDEAVVKRLQADVDCGEWLIQLFKIYERVWTCGMAIEPQTDVFNRFCYGTKYHCARSFQSLDLRFQILRVIIRANDDSDKLNFFSLLMNFSKDRHQFLSRIRV